MRAMSEEFRARLSAETGFFCHCWKIMRKDGMVQGFTDHDGEIVFDGIVFAADTGLQLNAQDERIGLSAGQSAIAGALVQVSVDEAALAGGLFDGASVETWLVDWMKPELRLLVNVETIGDVRRGEHAFAAELQPLGQMFEQETGRRFLKSCSADLGDAHCRVTLNVGRFTRPATVLQAEDASHFVVSIGTCEDGWFTGGRLRVTNGAQSGVSGTIRAHRQNDAVAQLALWTPLSAPLHAGDMVEVQAGCDKSFATCGRKFSNRVNFRGFPHIPGNDVLMAVASADTIMDGRSLFK